MKILGDVCAEHLINLFLEKEYAFEIEYLNKIIRVGHHKGTWSFAKILGEEFDDGFLWRDCFTGCEAENEVTKALVEHMIFRFDVEGSNVTREHEAKAIAEVLKVWAGNFNKILRVNVLQNCRNSSVDLKTGQLVLL